MKIAAVVIASALVLPSFVDAQTSQSSPPQDSALVAAAKRSTRTGKKQGIVITNESLAHAGASAHVTTTRLQPALAKMPEVAAHSSAARAVPAASAPTAKSQPKAAPHDDAESFTEGLDPEPISCPSCLPILGHVPHGLAVRKMELSTSPPRIVPPQPPDNQQ
jgi:hypothetical protein